MYGNCTIINFLLIDCILGHLSRLLLPFLYPNKNIYNMGQISIELTHDSNDFKLNVHSFIDKQYSFFENKWKEILERFEGKFLNNGYVIADPYGVNIDTSNFSRLDDGKANFDRAVCMFLENFIEIRGSGNDWSIGQNGFPDEFYFDLYRLLSYSNEIRDLGLEYNDDVPEEIHSKISDKLSKDEEWHKNEYWGFFCGNLEVSGDNGNYSLSIQLTPYGLIISSDYYEGEDSDDDWF